MLRDTGEGRIKALYMVGMDAAYSVADVNRVRASLRAADFVVVQDIFRSGTAEFADVVLPAASFAEKDGTFTNLERRVQRVRKAVEPPGEARPDWWIVCELAKRLGAPGFDYDDPSEIMAEMASLTPAFGGMSFERLDVTPLQWPCPTTDHPGTTRLHSERFSTPSGKGRFTALAYRPPAESPDVDFPFVLTTGRSLYHFHLAMTSQVDGLVELVPEDTVWLHPDDAERLGIGDGQPVRISSRRGQLTAPAQVTDRVLPGSAFMTFHFYKTPTNVLTAQALDPVAKTPEFKVTAVRIEPV
jgi:predicted molibdopterin-dependent oxidoreductase YjgC